MLNKKDLKSFQNVIEKKIRIPLEERYPNYVMQYFRYRERVGPHCTFCRSAARFMFVSEVHRLGQEFVNRFRDDNWENYS